MPETTVQPARSGINKDLPTDPVVIFDVETVAQPEPAVPGCRGESGPGMALWVRVPDDSQYGAQVRMFYRNGTVSEWRSVFPGASREFKVHGCKRWSDSVIIRIEARGFGGTAAGVTWEVM